MKTRHAAVDRFPIGRRVCRVFGWGGLRGGNIWGRNGSFRHTFGSKLVNGIRQPDGSLLCLSPKQVADLLGHSTSEITEMYYVKKDTARLGGITEGFEL